MARGFADRSAVPAPFLACAGVRLFALPRPTTQETIRADAGWSVQQQSLSQCSLELTRRQHARGSVSQSVRSRQQDRVRLSRVTCRNIDRKNSQQGSLKGGSILNREGRCP